MRLADVPSSVGATWGPTDWVEVTPAQVADYSAATGDPAAAGGDVVPALMVLALTNLFLPDLFFVEDAATGVNYGTGAVRFPAPAPAGRLRASATLVAADGLPTGVQTTVRVTVEAEGVAEPVCTVDAISRWFE